MKILITGAGGFIGNRLAIDLAASGHEVKALVRDGTAIPHLRHRNITPFYGDILRKESMQSAMSGCEQVYHLAAFAKLWSGDRNRFFDTNVRGTENVLELALDQGVKRLVFTSSCSVFGPSHNTALCEKDPRTIGFGSDYDLSKCLAESKVKEFSRRGLLAVIVNPSRVYGPGPMTTSNYITLMIKRCLEKKAVFIPDCQDILANYVYIDDVILGHRLAMQRGISGEQYILGGENISYARLESLIRTLFPHPRLISLSKTTLQTAAWLQLAGYQLSGRSPVFTPGTIKRYFRNMAVSSEKACRQLGYTITPIEEGLRRTFSHLSNTCTDGYQ